MDTVQATVGTELFVVDAGWYVGAGGSGLFDFESGLGNYQPDPDRFPNGLKPLTDHAHSLGMKFGIWVEPSALLSPSLFFLPPLLLFLSPPLTAIAPATGSGRRR